LTRTAFFRLKWSFFLPIRLLSTAGNRGVDSYKRGIIYK
jgi:hypothetical protein